MQWTDAAIIISARKYGENGSLTRVLTREYGVFSGVVRGATSAKMRGVLQAGNGVSATWQARLAQQLGTLKIELLEAHTAYIMNDAAKLSALSSACALIEMAFPERHPYPRLFASLHEFLQILSTKDDWLYDYINLELAILSESGFGLDLSECAATGRTDNLSYVSPKSGRAVCAEAGEPYKDKLLPLPEFLIGTREEARWMRDENTAHPPSHIPHHNLKEPLAGMQLTGYFLEHWVLAPHGKKLPAARARLSQVLNTL